MNPWLTACRKSVIAGALFLAGCNASPNASHDIDAEALYPRGTTRDDLEEKHSHSSLIYIVNQVPNDEFAAATVREMISLRKPRPSSYQVFTRKNFGPGDPYYSDYVFYNDQGKVLYTARKIPPGSQR